MHAPSRSIWIEQLADQLLRREQADQLPPVSSELSSRLCTLASSGPGRTRDYVDAIESLAAAYRTVFERWFQPTHAHKQPPSLLSLCTGYDAGVELLALLDTFGELHCYVSIELDAAAVACNRAQLESLPPGVARALLLQGDVRSEAAIAEAHAAAGPFDLAVALRPPVTATAYADERRSSSRAWLSPRVDLPVVLELLGLQERELLPRPLGLMFYAESERLELDRLLRALGFTSSLRSYPAGADSEWPTMVLT